MLILPDVSADVRREEAVNDWIGGRIQRRQTLEESGNCDQRLRRRKDAEGLEEGKYKIRRRTKDEY